jgi:sulfite exporter TauE/SafE
MARLLLSLFLTGFFLGVGPCLLSCGPLLASYIVATKNSSWGGLKTYFLFSLTRLVVYSFFGVLIGIFGQEILHRFFDSAFLKIIFYLFGIFVVILGLLLLFEKFPVLSCCARFNPPQKSPSFSPWDEWCCAFSAKGGSPGLKVLRNFTKFFFSDKDSKNIIIFGLIVSFSPCLPLFAVMGYIALLADHWLKGFLMMASFGLGTILSPMIIFSLVAGRLSQVLKKTENIYRWIKAGCGLILALLGVFLILTAQSISFPRTNF